MTSKIRLCKLLLCFYQLFIYQLLLTNLVRLPAQELQLGPPELAWSALPDLPNELGVAGPFVGIHNDTLMVAGGANIQRPVWDNPKSWLDEIWVLTKTESGLKWRNGGKLARPIAYGAAVSTPRGVLCIGGNDQNRNYREVFLLQWDEVKQQSNSQDYPPLPGPFAYGQATMVDDVIYVAGGQRGLQLDSAMSNLWSLNLADAHSPDKFKWRDRNPIPIPSRAFNITAHQHNGDEDCVYVIGGRHQINGVVHFLSDVWEFNPKTEVWRRRTELPRSVTAGTGIGFGQRKIFLLGGDDGSLFSKTEELKDQHPGFRKEALIYDAVTDAWTSAGATPQNQVTTIPVVWDDRIIIASGEVRPRVRTPAVWEVKLKGK